MNFLNMKTVVNKNMFCDHIMGATIAKYYGRDYELGFMRSMNLIVNGHEESVFRQLEYERNFFREDLAAYHGIRMKYMRGSYHEFLVAGNRLEYNSMYPDRLYALFFEGNGPYLFLGWRKQPVFLDIHKSKKEVEFDLSYINKTMQSFTIIEIEKAERFSELGAEECIDIIRNHILNEESCKDANRRLRIYKDKLIYCRDYEELYVDYEGTKFSDSLTHIFAGRIHFYYLVKRLHLRFGDESYGRIAESVMEDYHRWNVIWSLFYKGVLGKNLKKVMPCIIKNFEIIALLEEAIMNALLQGDDIKVTSEWNKKGKPFLWSDSARNIPLEKYYNNMAFGNPYGVYKGGLLPREGYDEFFDVRNVSSIHIVGKWFYERKDGYDNICCRGQIIGVPEDEYHKIAFVGCCFPGGYEATVVLKGREKIEKNILIGLSDIHSTIATQGDRIIYSSGLGVFSEGIVRKRYGYEGHLFLFEIQLDDGFLFEKVCLPDFPFMHIFALLLE